MTTQYTPILQLALPVTGELNGTWGDVVNDNITSMVEEAIAGLATISTWTTNAHTLTTADGVTDEARCAMLVLQTGSGGTALGGAGQVICPARTKLYVVKNDAAYAVTVKTSGGSGVAIAAGDTAFVFCDGTNVNACVTQIINGHITGNLTVDGNTTLGDSSADTVTINAGSTTLNDGGAIRFEDNAGGEYVAIKAPATVTATYTLTLPIDDGTNGQALITDGSGNLSWSTAASGDVYGPASATDNAVTRFDGTTGKLIQNSGVIIDDSNNVTGVVNLTSSGSVTLSGGTANGVAYLNGSKVLTTGSALTFNGTGLGVGASPTANYPLTLRSGSGDYTKVLDWGTQSGGSWGTITMEVSSPPYQTIINTSGLQFNISGSEQMRLTSTGLGIGTSSPAQKLDVVGNIRTSQTGATALVVANVNTPGTSYSSQFQLQIDGTYYGLVGAAGYAGLLTSGSAAGDMVLRTNNKKILFTTNDGSTTALTLDTSGNLGLGVTPSNAYTAGGMVAIQAKSAVMLGRSLTSWAQWGANYYSDSAGTTKYISSDYASMYQQYQGAHSWYTAPSGTAGVGIGFTQAMTLDASGRLNVGATSNIGGNTLESVANIGVYRFTAAASGPFINLGKSRSGTVGTNTIVQDQDNLGTVAFYGANGTGYTEAAYIRSIVNGAPGASNDMPGALLFATTADGAGSATERMRIDSSGNVGIGTSSPGEKLTVAGSININNRGASYALMTPDWRIYNSSTGNALVWDNYTTEFMRLSSAGNLGLGVTPSAWGSGWKAYQLGSGSLWGSAPNYQHLSCNAYYNGTNYIYQNTGAALDYSQSNGIHSWHTAPSGTAGAAITFTQAMTLDASGNLGIGTSAPAQKLDVRGRTGLYGSSDAYQLKLAYAYGNAGFWLGSPSDNALAFYNDAGTERMRIDSSGNVGIGTSSPSTKLYVDQGTSSGVSLSLVGGNTASQINMGMGVITSGRPFIGTNTNTNPLEFGTRAAVATLFVTDSTERMRIDSSGNVGIGTSSPNQKLHIYNGAGTNAAVNLKIENQYVGQNTALQFVSTARSWDIGTNIASSGTGAFEFYDRTAGVTRALIDSSGNLLVGTTDAGYTTGRGAKILVDGVDRHFAEVCGANTNATSTYSMYSTSAGAYRFYVDYAGTIHATSTSITAISDVSLKENIRDLETGLSEVLALKPRRFDWKNGDGNDVAGFIAQELEQVFPDLVTEAKYNDEETKKSIKMGDILPTLVKAIQELKAELDATKAEVAALKAN